MCSQVTCERCGKPTWRGCGAHVEQVLGHLPAEERCQCKRPGRVPYQNAGLWGWGRGQNRGSRPG